MKRLSATLLALVLAACAPSDPNAKNAAFAQGFCAQDVEAVWNATDADMQAQFDAIAEIYGLAGGIEIIANYIALDEGTKCDKAEYIGSYKDHDGNAASIYIFTFTDAEGTSSIFYVFTSTGSGVSNVE
ncbi:MAG TPA: hypothetical protein VGR43_04935 [Dehalococcoidia bacterium]|nr:hypothetical protein [Dehalococcoidia bacterium]